MIQKVSSNLCRNCKFLKQSLPVVCVYSKTKFTTGTPEFFNRTNAHVPSGQLKIHESRGAII